MKKSEYTIPGLEGMGVPGARNPANIPEITDVTNRYKSGQGVTFDERGKPLTTSEINLTPGAQAQLINLPTSMADLMMKSEGESPFEVAPSGATLATSTFVSPYQEANPRRDSLLSPLAGKHVVVVGLGGGAPIPIELAKCGVNNFTLIDLDVLGAENLIRHPCGIAYIGQNKAVAVANLMHSHFGAGLEINTYTKSVFEIEELAEIMSSADLLIIATDNEASRFYLNEMARAATTPAIFVGMFEGGAGGEVVTALSGHGCYGCLAEHIGRKSFLAQYQATVDKSTCVSARDTRAQPGLGVDQGMLCNIATRRALDVLVQTQKHTLPIVGKNWIVFSISGIPGILEGTLASMQHDIPVHSNCYVCGSQPS